MEEDQVEDPLSVFKVVFPKKKYEAEKNEPKIEREEKDQQNETNDDDDDDDEKPVVGHEEYLKNLEKFKQNQQLRDKEEDGEQKRKQEEEEFTKTLVFRAPSPRSSRKQSFSAILSSSSSISKVQRENVQHAMQARLAVIEAERRFQLEREREYKEQQQRLEQLSAKRYAEKLRQIKFSPNVSADWQQQQQQDENSPGQSTTISPYHPESDFNRHAPHLKPLIECYHILAPRSSSDKSNAVTKTSLRLLIPDTVVFNEDNPYFLSTSEEGFVYRVDNATNKFILQKFSSEDENETVAVIKRVRKLAKKKIVAR